jgi:hypothetical protein
MENLKKFTFINCICCGKKIELLDKVQGVPEDEIIIDDTYDPEDQLWNNGVLQKLSAGYGSSLDGDIFYLGICDSCIEEGYRNGRLRYKGDYIATIICKFSDEELKQQEQMRNRENNLNDLIP